MSRRATSSKRAARRVRWEGLPDACIQRLTERLDSDDRARLASTGVALRAALARTPNSRVGYSDAFTYTHVTGDALAAEVQRCGAALTELDLRGSACAELAWMDVVRALRTARDAGARLEAFYFDSDSVRKTQYRAFSVRGLQTLREWFPTLARGLVCLSRDDTPTSMLTVVPGIKRILSPYLVDTHDFPFGVDLRLDPLLADVNARRIASTDVQLGGGSLNNTTTMADVVGFNTRTKPNELLRPEDDDASYVMWVSLHQQRLLAYYRGYSNLEKLVLLGSPSAGHFLVQVDGYVMQNGDFMVYELVSGPPFGTSGLGNPLHTAIRKVTSLSFAWLSINNGTNFGVMLGRCPALSHLSLVNCTVSTPVLSALGTYLSLETCSIRSLDLSRIRLDKGTCFDALWKNKWLAKTKTLRSLKLGEVSHPSNDVDKLSPVFLETLARNTSIEKLDLSGMWLQMNKKHTLTVLDAVANMRSLRHLVVASLTTDIPKTVTDKLKVIMKQCRTLRCIDARGNKLWIDDAALLRAAKEAGLRRLFLD